MLCIGDECSSTFQACTFEHCTVVVAGAAYATLVDSTCRGGAVAAYARGTETRLTLERSCELSHHHRCTSMYGMQMLRPHNQHMLISFTYVYPHHGVLWSPHCSDGAFEVSCVGWYTAGCDQHTPSSLQWATEHTSEVTLQ